MNNIKNILWAEFGVIVLSVLLYLELYKNIHLYIDSIPFLIPIKLLFKLEGWNL
jgi:hypothetical protein